MSMLFRPQAAGRAGAGAYGSVLLARPVSHAVLTLLFAGFALALLVFLASVSHTRSAKVQGVLTPTQGLIRVSAMQAGVVVERRVHEGQQVAAGELLFVLASERASSGGAHGDGNAEQAIARLLQQRRDSFAAERAQQREQVAQRITSLRRKAEDLQAEQGRIAQQIGLQQRRVALAEAGLKRQEELRDAHFVSAVQVQDKQGELLDQQQRLADLQRAHAAVARDLATLQADERDLQLQTRRDAEAGARNIAATEQELAENEARRRILVRAPQDGTVTAIIAGPGQSVPANQGLAALLPAGAALEAELYAPSRAAGFVRPGMPVLLRYQAFAYQKFGLAHGTVREVSSAALRPEDIALPGAVMPAGAALEPLYRVRVALPRQTVAAYGAEVPLRAGALLDANILLERRRLYEWVLEPLYTITGRM